MTPHTLATLQREAKSAARRLARSLNLCRDAEADICQDLLADLLSRLHRFDPDRGTLGAFAGRIVANQASCIAKQNPTYYAQAVLYMDYARLDRHYLVCVSPGARRWTAVRTNADPVHATALKAKAERIIFADVAPQRIGGPDSFTCRFCDFSSQCHEGARAERNCRTCIAVEVSRDGGWRCTRFGHELSRTDQEAGCPEHRFLPDLVAGEQIDVIHGQIVYRLRDGSRWVDGGPRVHSIGDIIKRQACRSCGSLSWKVTEGAGPHAAGLRCLSCDTHGRWLQKAEVVA